MTVDQKIQDGIKRARKAKIKGWTTIVGEGGSAEFFNISYSSFTKVRIEQIEASGLTLDIKPTSTALKKFIDKKFLDGIERATKEGISGWDTIEGPDGAAGFFDVSYSGFTKERREWIRASGLTVNVMSNKEKRENTDKKILDGIERAIKEGISGWDAVAGKEGAAEFFNISHSGFTKERKGRIRNNGLYIGTILSTSDRKKAAEKTILSGIERALKEGISGWDSVAGKGGVAEFFGIAASLFTDERIEKIRTRGLTVKSNMSRAETRESTDKKLLEGIERAIKEGISGWDSVNGKGGAAEFFGVDRSAFNEDRIEKIRDSGLILSIREIEDPDKKLLEGIERAIKEGISGWDTVAGKGGATEFFNVSSGAFTEARKKMLADRGLEIKEKVKITSNMLFVVRSSEELGMRIDSAQALIDLSLDFFAREIRFSEDMKVSLAASTKAVKEFDDKEAKSCVEAVAWELIENGIDDFSMFELKLGLFKEQVYFSEQRIESCLEKIGIDTNELHLNTLDKRFRAAKRAIEYGLVKINYVDKLPSINNCENRNIFIHNSIRKKSSFIKLWQEYAETMMREDIGGSISRSPLPKNFTIEEEIRKNSTRAKAYLVDRDSIVNLKEMGYEGIVALFLYGSRRSKSSMPRALHSLAARLTGFFLFLSQKGLAVAHSRFLTYTGGEVVSRIAEYFNRDHPVSKALPGFISSTTSRTANKFSLLSHKLAIAIRHDADLKDLSSEEINAYVDSVHGEGISGTLTLDSFCIKLLHHLGNNNALKRRAELNIEARWTQELLNSSISADVLKWYKPLTVELIELIEERYNNETISEALIVQHIKAIAFLYEFLSIFDRKLNRSEMINALNPKIKSNQKEHIVAWSDNIGQKGLYEKFIPTYVMLFANLNNTTYLGLFPGAWIRRKGRMAERSYIRNGLELPVLVTFQDAVLSEPFPDERYPFLRSTPKGEMIDISNWWNYDFSPVPVICAWLTSKLPRRGKHIRFLDVNKFLVFNSDGTLNGVSFNTDKNTNADAKKDLYIPKSLLLHAFTEDELQLLINYTKYISQAYSYMDPVKYTSKKYAPIMPLFPHHNKNDVLMESLLPAYMTKVMIKTQIIVRHNAMSGIYDPYYSTSALETKKEYLSTIDLVVSRGKYDVPNSIEELNSFTVNQCRKYFKMEQGVHNFRHAISTALAHLGLSIFRVRVLTGHKVIDTLGNVYIHGEEEVISLLRATTSTFFDDIRSPADAGNQFISKICMPLVKSKDPSAIFKTLKEHGFISLPRKVQKGPEGVKIDTTEDGIVSNGVEIASLFNPVSWVSKSFGICPVSEGCPEESRGVCCLCPFLIFNASFVKGIILELNDALNELAVLNAKNVESIRSHSADEVHKQVAQKMSEVMSWNHMFSRAESQLLGEDFDSANHGGTSITGLRIASKNLFGVRTVSIDESDMEILYGAMELDLNDVRFDKKAKGVAWKIAMRCAKNKDFATIEQLEKDGLNKFLSKFGRMNFEEKKVFVLEMMGGTESAANSPLVQQKNTPLIELK